MCVGGLLSYGSTKEFALPSVSSAMMLLMLMMKGEMMFCSHVPFRVSCHVLYKRRGTVVRHRKLELLLLFCSVPYN